MAVNSSPAGSVASSAIQQLLEEAHARFAGLDDGQPATYIPELAGADPRAFGIALTTANGHRYGVGAIQEPFTIQSISKPFTYALALTLLGRPFMQGKVGVEPSGDAFNAISLDPATGIPRNPMINAGAIATTAQLLAHEPERAESRLLAFYGALAGRPLEVDEAVFRSERDTGHRNRAIGHLLRGAAIIGSDPEPALQLYFRQCAVTVTCMDLAAMAVTLACQGRQPLTGEQVIDPAITSHVMAVMGSCGMYDDSGRWLETVGMPAKSGVAGGVLAVVPGQLGLAVYSPPLDSTGNSVRGLAVCAWLSERLELNLFNRPPLGSTAIRSTADGRERHSRRWRSSPERERLDRHGERIQVLQAQGVLDFAATEELLAVLSSAAGRGSVLVLDLARVTAVWAVGAELLRRQLRHLAAGGTWLLLCHASHLPALAPASPADGPERDGWGQVDQLDEALERAEDQLLRELKPPEAAAPAWSGDGLLARLPQASQAVLAPLVRRQRFRRGELVCRRGGTGEGLYLIESGRFSARLTPPTQGGSDRPASVRLATLCAGTCFGEVAFLSGTPRSTDVVAEDDGTCLVLSRDQLDQLERQHPQVVIDLLRALHHDLAVKLQRTSRELSLLEEG